MNGMFNMFGLMGIIVPVMSIAIFVLAFTMIIKGLRQERKNDQMPRLTVEARVLAKRTQVGHHRNSSNHTSHSYTRYYATFEVASGDRMELQVPGPESGLLVEGDFGDLTFQGTRYLSFDRKAPTMGEQ